MTILSDITKGGVFQNTPKVEDYTSEQIANAFTSVISYMVADAFDLVDEEITWVTFKVREVIDEFKIYL